MIVALLLLLLPAPALAVAPHSGEIATRSDLVMKGYWTNPEATTETLRGGGLHTGDMGTCDEKGYFRIVDRKKDLVITSGFNVYPANVEPVLRQCPCVKDVAIVGELDAHCGEVVKAVVTVNPDIEFNRSAFDAFAVEHLSKHKRPKIVEVLEGDLPRNFLGKVLRRQLRSGDTTLESSLDARHSAVTDVAKE